VVASQIRYRENLPTVRSKDIGLQGENPLIWLRGNVCTSISSDVPLPPWETVIHFYVKDPLHFH
jgi:hypothetical protein